MVEGDFINERKQYLPGTSLHFKAGNAHGPHTTKTGGKLLVSLVSSGSSQRLVSADPESQLP